MSDFPPTPPPPVDYASPATASPDRQRFAYGVAIGIAVGVGLVVGSPILGAVIDARVNRGQELAGLGGLFLGGIIGGISLLVATGVAFGVARAGRTAMIRGVARGLLVAVGMVALTAGICAIAARR